MRRRLPLLAVLAVTALGACGGDDDGGDVTGSDPTTATVAPVTTAEPDQSDTTADTAGAPSTSFELSPSQPTLEAPGGTGPGGTAVPIGDDPSANLMAAVTDLAARLDVDASTILVVSEENVTWRNGAIGCPEPGMSYTDALVDGVRIVLDVDGVQYSYHAGGARPMFYCEKPQLPGD